uniref:Uncharacterized protein n=1 Tax=Caenorhabditis tropicalis TaxID=1561998 RepID=A0A1I7T7D7_9PELO
MRVAAKITEDVGSVGPISSTGDARRTDSRRSDVKRSLTTSHTRESDRNLSMDERWRMTDDGGMRRRWSQRQGNMSKEDGTGRRGSTNDNSKM